MEAHSDRIKLRFTHAPYMTNVKVIIDFRNLSIAVRSCTIRRRYYDFLMSDLIVVDCREN